MSEILGWYALCSFFVYIPLPSGPTSQSSLCIVNSLCSFQSVHTPAFTNHKLSQGRWQHQILRDPNQMEFREKCSFILLLFVQGFLLFCIDSLQVTQRGINTLIKHHILHIVFYWCFFMKYQRYSIKLRLEDGESQKSSVKGSRSAFTLFKNVTCRPPSVLKGSKVYQENIPHSMTSPPTS